MLLDRRVARRVRPLAVGVACWLALGCATTTPYVGQGPHPQITRGHPVPVVDFLGNVFALPAKLLFWNWKIGRHSISEGTERYLTRYIDDAQTMTDGTHFSLNEYAPGRALKRLAKNRKVAWPYRLLIGLPATLVFDVLLPGRLFAFVIASDYYNPWNDTVNIYSDLPSVALHEAGHVDDINSRRFKGTYAFVGGLPFVVLYLEAEATGEAIRYATESGDRPLEFESYKVLYPAYGSYVGGHVPFPGAQVIGIAAGHVVGRITARSRRGYYQRRDAAQAQALATPLPAAP